MNWTQLDHYDQLEEIKQASASKGQVIFKHSRTCSISSMIVNRLERDAAAVADYYFLDLLAYRELSEAVAHTFGVQHESPQVLVIVDGKCVYHESHYGITMDDIRDHLMALD